MTQDAQAGAGAQPAPAQQPEAQRLAQFLLNMQTRLGSCREACGDEHSMKAWDDYSRAAALLAAKGALDERELFEAWVRTHEDAHGAFDDGSARAGWQARAALAAAPALASDTESVLIDGIAYEVPAAVAGELLSLHLDLLAAAPAQAQDDRAAFTAYLQECDDCEIVPDVAGAFHAAWQKRAAPAQAVAVPAVFGDEDHVLVPRGLIGSACSAIEKKRDGTKTLAELRRYTVGDLSASAPAQEHATQLAGQAKPVMP